MKKTSFIILALFLIGTCARLTRSIGKSNEVVVISSHLDHDLIIETLQLYNYVPQEEGLFKFILVSDTALPTTRSTTPFCSTVHCKMITSAPC